jgi:tellurite resistance protein TerB
VADEIGDGGLFVERTILAKLVSEVRHFHNRDFLKAAMAVCALAAVADDEVKLSEHYRINAILAKEPALLALDSKKAIDTLYVYVNALQTDWSSAAEVLYKKVRRMAGNHKRARTLMRVAYLVIAADGEVNHKEREEFGRICDMLSLDPREVFPEQASSAPTGSIHSWASSGDSRG